MHNSTGVKANTLSARQMAKLAGVSVAMISMAVRVQHARPDLMPSVLLGKITLPEAMRSISNAPKPTRYSRLVEAWNRCTDEERFRFYEEVSA